MPKKVLLIDYEPRSVDRVRALLEGADYTLTLAKDGEEGLAAFSAGSFDVILLAGMLPRLPSAEVIREIRRKGGATAPPILLMVSGYHGTNPKADAQRVGAFDILVKPFSDEVLKDATRAAADSTDMNARTMRISAADLLKSSSLTSDDIFSDVLQDVGGEKPAPGAPSRAMAAAAATEDAVEKRLRDTLSGILGKGGAQPPGAAPPPAAAPAGSPGASHAAASGPRYSTDADIDRMISDTLSGLKAPGAPSLHAGAGSPPAPAAGTGRPRGDTTPPRGTSSSSASSASSSPSPSPSPVSFGSAGSESHAPAGPAAHPPAPVTVSPATARAAGAPRPVMSAPVLASSGPDRFGQYEILERIAAGGMAELSKARLSGAEGFEKIVAIKKILPHLADNDEFIAMFADEAKLAAQLNHPNIVHIFDLGKIDSGGYFIAMEYVDGRDLRAILQSAREVGTPLPPPLAVYVASKIAAALDYAHRRRDAEGHDLNIVHGDVSPPNILISYEGDIKLCDFGIAKAASKAQQTQSGALKGKVPYMSPEQAWGRPLDRRSDLFSLGCVLFEMLTEQKLFRGDSDLSVLEKVRAAEVVAPSLVNPEVPKSLDAVLLKALAREPDDRYANASEMQRDLEAVLYSYSPAPGSADLAIYLHRLQAEEAAVAESNAREASRSATPAAPERKRKSKGAPVVRRTTGSIAIPRDAGAPGAGAAGGGAGAGHRDPASAGIYGAQPAPRLESEKKSRAPLYVAILIACAALAAAIVYVVRRPATERGPVATRATPLPVAPPPTAAPAATPLPAASSSMDPRAIEEEVQRQLAARKKELQKALEPPKTARDGSARGKAEKAEEAAAAPAGGAKEKEPAAEPVRTAAEPPRREKEREKERVEEAEPTAVPAPPRAAPSPVRAAEPREEVVRGELAGPGPGVVEPVLISSPRIAYPAIARQRQVSGKVVVLVLVNEEGSVTDSRLQQGVSSNYGVNEAVLGAVRASRFHAATKNGTPVKMWRTVVVDVKP